MLAIGGAAGAASFTHVHNVAAAHGQPGWLAWADAIVLELMSIAAGLELRRRKRARVSTRFPAVVLGCAVTLSLAAQVVEAEPSPIGWIAAAVPALGFLVMVKVALGHAGTANRTGATPSVPHQPDRTADAEPIDTAPPAGLVGELSAARTVRPSGASHRRDGRTRHRKTNIASGPRTALRTRTDCCPQHDTSGTGSPRTGSRSPGQRSPMLSGPAGTPSPTPGYPISSRPSKPSRPHQRAGPSAAGLHWLRRR